MFSLDAIRYLFADDVTYICHNLYVDSPERSYQQVHYSLEGESHISV